MDKSQLYLKMLCVQDFKNSCTSQDLALFYFYAFEGSG